VSDAEVPGNEDGERRDLVAGTLRGYRSWRLVPRGVPLEPGVLPLSSMTRPQITWPPELSASCTSPMFGPMGQLQPRSEPAHRAPDRDCHCGIYAWYSPADARTFSAEVFGVVQASGLVMLGTSGFRAERAQIAAIATRNRRLAQACNDAGIPVYRRRRDLIADHPPDDVATLVGDVAPPRNWHPRAFAMVICLSVWMRAAILIAAAGLLPPAAVIASIVVSEVAILAVVLRQLGRTPKVSGG
jgi:hypothetical protein